MNKSSDMPVRSASQSLISFVLIGAMLVVCIYSLDLWISYTRISSKAGFDGQSVIFISEGSYSIYRWGAGLCAAFCLLFGVVKKHGLLIAASVAAFIALASVVLATRAGFFSIVYG